MLYAVFAEYSPCITSVAFVSCTFCTKSQSLMKFAISSTLSILHSPRVQLWCSSSSFTERFFIEASLNKSGKTSIGACPFSQVDCLNDALIPLPRVTPVLARNSCRSTALTADSVPLCQPKPDPSQSTHTTTSGVAKLY